MSSLTSSDLQSLLAVAVKAAQMAGAHAKSKWGTRLNVEYKGEINLVTEVDKACEAMIVETLRADFPEHDILGEEGMSQRKDSPFKWVIDPLDGTTNFAHAYPLFCVSIALEHAGEIVVGVVYEPLLGELYTAVKGGGAHLNGNPLRVSATETAIKALVGTGFSYNFKQNAELSLEYFRKALLQVQGIRRDGVAAIDICYVAAGRFDAFFELNLFPWDVAAGLLILNEAGGRVTRFDGTPFNIYDKEILASNGLIHAELSAILTAR